MASLLLNAAPVDYQDSININKNEQSSNFSKKQPKNKTINISLTRKCIVDQYFPFNSS